MQNFERGNHRISVAFWPQKITASGIAINIDIFYIGRQVYFSDNTEKLNDPRPDMHNINSVFFSYPLVLVPVPTQLGKIASKSNNNKNMFVSYCHKFRLPYFVSIVNFLISIFGDNFLNSVLIFLLV